MERLDRQVVEEHGVVDVLVNNAGIGVAGGFLETGVEEWRRVLDVNLWGVLHGCRLVARRMVDRGVGRPHRQRRVGGGLHAVEGPAGLQHQQGGGADDQRVPAGRARASRHRRERDLPGVRQHQHHPDAQFVGGPPPSRSVCATGAPGLYRRRNYPPERVAAAIVRAVERDQAVVPVTVEARAMQRSAGSLPGVVRRLAKLDAL